jgi:hypothetical protein
LDIFSYRVIKCDVVDVQIEKRDSSEFFRGRNNCSSGVAREKIAEHFFKIMAKF